MMDDADKLQARVDGRRSVKKSNRASRVIATVEGSQLQNVAHVESAKYAASASKPSLKATEADSPTMFVSARPLDNGNHPLYDTRQHVMKNHLGHIHGSSEAQPTRRKSERMKAGVAQRA